MSDKDTMIIDWGWFFGVWVTCGMFWSQAIIMHMASLSENVSNNLKCSANYQIFKPMV